MNPDQALYELLDQYSKGKLNSEDAAALEERMRTDSVFREKAERHLAIIQELKFYGDRSQLREQLNEFHTSVEPITIRPSDSSRPKKYWPMLAVAASVALICIAGTFYFTRSLETQQEVAYRELRGNVDQLKKEQKMIRADLAETKEKVFPGKYTGTGFLISPNGYAVTSYHVIRDADSVVLENEKFGRLKATVVHSDPVNDISILKIDKLINIRSLPYVVWPKEASLAEDVYTLGFPREDVVFGEGAISALTGFRQNPNAYQVSVPVNPGNSGGPLLNSQGNLVGIISGLQTQTYGAAFAIKSSVLLNTLTEATALDTLSTPFTLSKQNSIRNTTRVQQVKQWKDFVFMIRVYKE